ncbi:hypothetical protein [Phycobacter sp. K97]|uniref:hypothetical protein n=1 Tax=Phycobacter sedimenti TaxID=3133977 RepID=UPI00311FCAAF
MLLRLLFCLIALVLTAVHPDRLEAREISGQAQPAFTEAAQLWLDGSDLEALEALSSLARSGNTAAQILLAQIASRGHMHVHVTSDLPRKDRISLLRIPKGLSGKSWLTEAQNIEPLAAALLQSGKIGEKAPAIAALIEYGEPTTALLAAKSMIYQGESTELLEVLEGLDGKLPEEASVILLWALYHSENSDSGRYVGLARVGRLVLSEESFLKYELSWTTVSPLALVERSDLRANVIRLSDDVRSWTPLRNFCEANCQDSRQSCTAVGASALSAAGPFSLRSPAESLIPNDVYWSSARAEADMVRQIRDVKSWYNWTDFTEINSCFFENVQAAQAKHGHAK